MEYVRSLDAFAVAALHPAQWTETLDRLAEAAGADGATLVFGPSTPETVAASRSMLPFVSAYFELRQVDDPREARVVPARSNGFLTDFDFFTQAEIARDPFYQDFLKPHGYGWHGVALLADHPVPAVLSLKRSLRRGPLERREIAALDRILPYLRNAATAAAVTHGAMQHDRLDTFARVGLGAVLIDRAGRVVAANDAIPPEDGLNLASGVPRAAHRGDQAALEAAIALALAGGPVGERPPPRRVTLRRPSGRRPLILEVMPIREPSALWFSDAVALLIVTDLDRALAPAVAELRLVFGLTAKEAELATRMATGMPLDAAADALRITRAHARQRLKTVFAKTETHRQAELVALLLRLRGRDG